MAVPLDLPTFAFAATVVGGAYVIFGISTFGAALTFTLLCPFAMAGLFLGNRLQTRMSLEGLLRVLNVLLLLIGASLLGRALTNG